MYIYIYIYIVNSSHEVSYNSVIQAWAKEGDGDCAGRLVKLMCDKICIYMYIYVIHMYRYRYRYRYMYVCLYVYVYIYIYTCI